ncbi:hypothetical protein DFQ28_007969 [Apophysomyces sp. BC1034]|nr:hypothetical protein DFQ30_007618 [Apophysomyces sp. BC1015]KAG0175935.1 hypothetical protein DFQ29_006755 [Apophysomyces sp. BC1021]KAG0186350.1 hypothetical protein DFQ28_007969 [Apophysomyces sp. BC1034]
MSHEREPLLAHEDLDEGNNEISNEPVNHNQSEERPQAGRFSLLEKILFVLTISFFIVLCIFIGLYARRVYDGNPGEATPVPTNIPTKPPTKAEDIDTTLDPCDDFYAFTCSSWMKEHDIPEGKSSTGTFNLLATDNIRTLRNILSENFDSFYRRTHPKGDHLPEPDKLVDEQNFNKFKNYFDSCMNESVIDAHGPEPVYSLLRGVLKQYPAGTRQQDQQLTKTLVYLAKHGISVLFDISVDADPVDPQVSSLAMYQDGLTLPSKEYYARDDIVDTLYDTVAGTMGTVFGKSREWYNWEARTVAKQVVDFEKSLAEISDFKEDLMDPKAIYNPRTLSEISKLAPTVDWGLYVDDMILPNAPHPDTVIVSSPHYIANLSTLLENTPVRTIQSYFLWKVVEAYSDALSADVRQEVQKLRAKLTGTDAKISKPRWETCLNEVSGSLGFIAGRYYVLDRFGGDAKKKADAFVNSIKDVFVSRLPDLTWLDSETREKAVEKVDKLITKMGYPTSSPDVMSPIALSDYYTTLNVDKDDFFGNYVRSRQWAVTKGWREVGKTPDRFKWLMTPMEVNAYYNPSFNEIVFPAGILQHPFFSKDYPEYLNYGGIGSVIGHELTHGFDNSGRQFDADGRLVQWWTNETAQSFDEKAQCFVKQYSEFTVEDGHGKSVHVNGKMTLGENLADNGGLGEAYLAWKQRYHTKKYNNELLPGLDEFSPEQLFFINFGRIWCRKFTNEQQVQNVLTDEHSPAQWRIIGAIQNSKHFAEVFKCPASSRMNPGHKCELW